MGCAVTGSTNSRPVLRPLKLSTMNCLRNPPASGVRNRYRMSGLTARMIASGGGAGVIAAVCSATHQPYGRHMHKTRSLGIPGTPKVAARRAIRLSWVHGPTPHAHDSGARPAGSSHQTPRGQRHTDNTSPGRPCAHELSLPRRVRRPGRLGPRPVEVDHRAGPRIDGGPDVLGAARERRAVPRRPPQRLPRRQLQPGVPRRQGRPHLLQRQDLRKVERRHRPHLGIPDEVGLPDPRLLARLVPIQREPRQRRRGRRHGVVRQRQMGARYRRARQAQRRRARQPDHRRGQRLAHLAGGVGRRRHAVLQGLLDGAAPYFTVPAGSLPDWQFNDPGYQMFPVFDLAVAGSGGGDPRGGKYPANMLIDYIRVW